MVSNLTVGVVGTYDSLVDAVAAMNSGEDVLVTDHHELVILPGGQGTKPYAVIKYARTNGG